MEDFYFKELKNISSTRINKIKNLFAG